MVPTSFLRSCRANYILASYEIRKNQGNFKMLYNYILVSSFPPEIKILLTLAKTAEKYKFSSSALFHKKLRVFLKYFPQGCLWK